MSTGTTQCVTVTARNLLPEQRNAELSKNREKCLT